jgi:hypothetical protein
VRVVFSNTKSKKDAFFSGPVTLATWGSEQYVWINDGLNSHADPDHPPVSTTLSGGARSVFTLPKASITVLRGSVAGVEH